MNQRKIAGQADVLSAARREQRRIAMFNLPYAYKLALLEPRHGTANDDSSVVVVEAEGEA